MSVENIRTVAGHITLSRQLLDEAREANELTDLDGKKATVDEAVFDQLSATYLGGVLR